MQTYFLRLFNFDYWAGKKLLVVMQGPAILPKRIHDLFSHLLSATQIWHGRLAGVKVEIAVWEDFPQENWSTILEHNKILMETYLQHLTADKCTAKVNYTNSKGLAFQTRAEDILTHMITHSTYHQGQIVAALKPFLTVLPDISYISYIREKQPAEKIETTIDR